MNNFENLQFFLLIPYGFEVSIVKYDTGDFTPYREVTHPSYEGKIWKYTPEFAQDIQIFGVPTVDVMPIIEKELICIFGFEPFLSADVYFPNYRCAGNIGEKRVFTIELSNIPEDKIKDFIKYAEEKLKTI